jgi:two-component system, chemotaxis family, chemotaxis protein CheY
MKVLLVEDAEGMRGIIRDMLKKIGFTTIVEAKHGGEAWEALGTGDFDLLLTDWNMPVMDGISLTRKVRAEVAYEDLPILVITERQAKEDVVAALRAGVDGYLAKPFKPSQLRQKIGSILGQRGTRRIKALLTGSTRISRSSDLPLVALADMLSQSQLALAENRHILNYLNRAVTAVHLVNNRDGAEPIGYILANNCGAATRELRLMRGHVKLLLVSPDLTGGGLTLARLASIGNDQLSVLLVCENLAEIPTKVRSGLELLGVMTVERHKMDLEGIEGMLDQYVLAKMRTDEPERILTPEEIRRRLENDIRTMVDLPVLPEVFHRITQLDRDRESEIQQWIEAVATDPLTQAQIIRRARSPIYGFRGEINDIGKAIVLLGKNTVKELVVSSALRRACEGIEDPVFSVEDYWLHSAAVGVTARLLSFSVDRAKWRSEDQKQFEEFALDEEVFEALKKFNLNERLALSPDQDPFTGGMMHDIGKVAMVHAYPGLFPMIIQTMEAQKWNRPMRIAEELATGGIDHCRVGLILAQSWKLGDAIRSVVENHHAPPADDGFSTLIALADFMASGLYRYPSQARYPMTSILQTEEDGEEGEEAAKEAPPTTPTNEPEGETDENALEPVDDAEAIAAIAAEPTAEAMPYFLPGSVVEDLGIPLGELVDLGRALSPTIRRLTEGLRQGS